MGGQGSPWPFFASLTIGGAGLLGFGIWLLAVSLPEYNVPAIFLLAGGALLWFAYKVFRTINSDDTCWLGCDQERLILRMGASIASWPWADVSTFRVTETVQSGFEVRRKRQGRDREVNFSQTTTVILSSEAREGPAIRIPFEIFMLEEGRERDRAENFSLFLNDVRQRGRSGGLTRKAPTFLAPIGFNIVRMRDGAPALTRERPSGTSGPAVQRR